MQVSEKRRNLLLLIICYLVYGSSYFLKYSYSSNIDMMMIKYSVSKGDTGLVSTLFFIAYGIGQFVNGILSKKINIKLVLPIVLGISAIINVGVLTIPAEAFGVIKYVWCINGFLLSVLWPCSIKVLSENTSSSFKNTSVIIYGSVTAVGTSVTYGLSALFKFLNHFEWIYIAAAIFAVLAISLWLIFYNKMIMPPNIRNEEVPVEEKKELDPSLYIVPTIGFVIVIGFISIVSAFGKEGMQTWFPTILEEQFGTSESFSTLLTILFPFAGILATYIAVVLNKKIKNYILLSTILTFTGVAALCLGFAFNFSEIVSLVIATVILCICCSAIVNLTTSIIPLRIKNTKNSGFYAGLFNGCFYVGTAAVTYGLGAVAEEKGWNFVFTLMIIILAVGFIGLMVYYLIDKLVLNKKQNTLGE